MFCSNCGKELDSNMKFCPNCGYNVTADKDSDKQSNNKHAKNKVYNITILFILIIITSIIYVGLSPNNPPPAREPQNLECVNHNNLCIATTDVKYDYTTIKTRTPGYPAYNKEWSNGWASAQNACKTWGGRLPSLEEFVTIVDAYNKNKIRLEDYKSYLSSTQINAYRIWAYSNREDFARNGYDSKSIYDSASSIAKSGDWIITGDYNSGTAYTYNARCVKDINTQKSSSVKESNTKNVSNTLKQTYNKESSKISQAEQESLDFLNNLVYSKVHEFNKILYADESKISDIKNSDIESLNKQDVNIFATSCVQRNKDLLNIYKKDYFIPAFKKYKEYDNSIDLEEWIQTIALSETSLFYDFFTFTESNLRACQNLYDATK